MGGNKVNFYLCMRQRHFHVIAKPLEQQRFGGGGGQVPLRLCGFCNMNRH